MQQETDPQEAGLRSAVLVQMRIFQHCFFSIFDDIIDAHYHIWTVEKSGKNILKLKMEQEIFNLHYIDSSFIKYILYVYNFF